MSMNNILGNFPERASERFRGLLATLERSRNPLFVRKRVEASNTLLGVCATALMQAGAADNGHAGFGQDFNVFPYRVPLDVNQLQLNPVVERQVRATVDLHRTG